MITITPGFLFTYAAATLVLGFIAGMKVGRWADRMDASYKEKRSAQPETAKPLPAAG
jgi:hypothetical protein